MFGPAVSPGLPDFQLLLIIADAVFLHIFGTSRPSFLALCLALYGVVGCRRDDAIGAGAPQGVPPSPLQQGSAQAAPVAAPAAAATQPVAVVTTPFDVKEPTALRAPSPVAEGCSLDQVGAQAATDVSDVSREGEVRLVGWAADTVGKTIPPLVVVQLVGKKKYYAPAVHATLRPDVAQVYGASTLVGSGWDLLGTFSKVEPGTYDVQLLEVSATGDALVCDPKRKLVVK